MATKVDYAQLGPKILELVGGEANVLAVTHCATRLRFKLQDTDLAQTEPIQKLPGVVTVMKAGGLYQVVIGNEVQTSYQAILAGGAMGGAFFKLYYQGQVSIFLLLSTVFALLVLAFGLWANKHMYISRSGEIIPQAEDTTATAASAAATYIPTGSIPQLGQVGASQQVDLGRQSKEP